MLEQLYSSLKQQLLAIDGMVSKPYVPTTGNGPKGGIEAFQLKDRHFAGLRLTDQYLMLYLSPIYELPDLEEKYRERLKPVRSGKSCLKITKAEKLDREAVAAILAEGAARW